MLQQFPADLAAITLVSWDGERLFQAARFGTEMQYQHLVFEEFARRIQPVVDPFFFNSSPDIDPSIVAEFAHTVYRFGHSMLTGTVDRLDNDLATVDGADQASLLAAFLNPQMFIASGANQSEAAGEHCARLVAGSGQRDGRVHRARRAQQSARLAARLGRAEHLTRPRHRYPIVERNARSNCYDAGVSILIPYTSWIDFAIHIKQ